YLYGDTADGFEMGGPPGPYVSEGQADGSVYAAGEGCFPNDVGPQFGHPCYTCCNNPWQNLSVFGGFQAFNGPVDQGRNGNFGIHEGINWGSSLWPARGTGYQTGGQIAQSTFSGNDVFSRSAASRVQYFLTAGVFRRASAATPWQWGVGYDYLA